MDQIESLLQTQRKDIIPHVHILLCYCYFFHAVAQDYWTYQAVNAVTLSNTATTKKVGNLINHKPKDMEHRGTWSKLETYLSDLER